MVSRLRNPLVWGPISVALLALVIWRSGLLDRRVTRVDAARSAPRCAGLCLLPPVLWAVRSAGAARVLRPPRPRHGARPDDHVREHHQQPDARVDGRARRLYLLRAYHGGRLRDRRRGHPHRAARGHRLPRGERGDRLDRGPARPAAGGSSWAPWRCSSRSRGSPTASACGPSRGSSPIPIRRLGGGRWPGVIAGLLAAEHRIGRLLTDPPSCPIRHRQRR